MSLRCRLGIHDYRDENGWQLPTWWDFSTPRTYRCTRCGDERTLTPPHWDETRAEIDEVKAGLRRHSASAESNQTRNSASSGSGWSPSAESTTEGGLS